MSSIGVKADVRNIDEFDTSTYVVVVSIEEFIDQLIATAVDDVVCTAVGGYGLGRFDDGTIVPYDHILYAPIDPSVRGAIEDRHGRKIPDLVWRFLRLHNGAQLFQKRITVFGYPSISDTIGQAIDFIFTDVYGRPAGIPDHWFSFGAFSMTKDKNALIFVDLDGQAYVMGRDVGPENFGNIVTLLSAAPSWLQHSL